MTKPKEHHPGQVAELTRRTNHRRYFWRPGPDTRELFGYMLGKYCTDWGQTIHSVSLMSNHTHILVTDNTCRRSDFMRDFFSQTSRKRNLQIRRRENLWSAGEPGDMVALDLEVIIDRVLYIALQPVAAGCVERVEDWSGFQILPRDWGKPMRFERPDLCGPTMPEFVEFTPMPPPGFEDLPLEDVIKFFEALIAREEKRYARSRRRPVQGIEACEALSPFHVPSSEAPMRKLNPRFCTSDEQLLARALEHQRQFRSAHRAARLCGRLGKRRPVFPAGTIQLVRLVGVRCRRCPSEHAMSTRTAWTPGVRALWDDWLNERVA